MKNLLWLAVGVVLGYRFVNGDPAVGRSKETGGYFADFGIFRVDVTTPDNWR